MARLSYRVDVLCRPIVLGLVVSVVLWLAGAAAAEAKPTQEEFRKALKLDGSVLADADSLQLSYAEAVDSVSDAVVQINSLMRPRIPRQLVPYLDDPRVMRFFPQYDPRRNPGQTGLGSGFVVTSDGYIITNNHVVEGADELEVIFPSREESYPAVIVGRDPNTEVALIKIDAENLPVATLADSSKIRVGDVALAIGSPMGLSGSVTMGIVSALGRDTATLGSARRGSRRSGILGDSGYESFIQTDAAINSGNSGGPLVDGLGRVIGVNTFIFTGGAASGNIGLGFAIPINMVLRVAWDLADDGQVERGYLGIDMVSLTRDIAEMVGLPQPNGVVVRGVAEDSPAERAGLRRSDIILRVDGEVVEDREALRMRIGNMQPGQDTILEVLRGRQIVVVPARIGKSEGDQWVE
jgi:serine protease Do